MLVLSCQILIGAYIPFLTASVSQGVFIRQSKGLFHSLSPFFFFFFFVSHSFYYWNVVFVQSVLYNNFSCVVLSVPMWVHVRGEHEVSGFPLHFILAFYIYKHIFHQHCIMWEILIIPFFPVLYIYSWTFFSVRHIFQTQWSSFFITPTFIFIFSYMLCSLSFFSLLLAAMWSHFSEGGMVTIGLIIMLSVLTKMVLRSTRFDLA